MTGRLPRRLTKPQRARAERVFRRATDAAAATIGSRLVNRATTMRGGEPHRFYAVEQLVDRDMTYIVWIWARRNTEDD